ncbi:MAG TPA: DNA mismatch repair endonuclease MutL [Longimicrobiales bacterium]|nr:DNA mismatch repair endonuclease MutL [Longimicrobiales bacterium]
MPRRIQILPDTLANQIAAGEVVERPASVVKELVENALDAAATRVDVVIRNGGKTEIRVSDDGQGMGREDALLALDRHATSKIRSEDDLRAVRTFGFRGEALPSIGSVSRLTLETAEAGGVGSRVRVSAGRIMGAEDCARQPGTTVLVRSLFFNVPARAKFMKSAAVETRAIAEVMTSLALANLSAAFRLESNGRTLLELPATRDLPSRAADLWGDAFAAALIPVTHSAGGVEVAGLVERPDAAVSGPRRVHLFVGGRPFRERALVTAAERGYRTTVPQGARPSLLLYLDVPDGRVDVNVHPSKAEVRFDQPAAVEEAFEAAIRSALAGVDSAATLDRRPPPPQIRTPPAEGPPDRGGRPGQPARPTPQVGPNGEGQLTFFVAAAPDREPREDGVPGDAAEEAGVPAERRYALWQLHDTYIIAETRSGMLIIDQHSAHERILFEALMRDFDAGGRPSQRLLFPVTLRLSPGEYAVVEQTQSLLQRAGFEAEPFGGRTVIINAAPNPHPWFDAERCLREMVAELAEGSELTRAARNQYERLAMTFACKAAIKAGQRLSPDEMRRLFDQLFATELPYHDVHGRPTIVRLSLDELERRFGRHG